MVTVSGLVTAQLGNSAKSSDSKVTTVSMVTNPIIVAQLSTVANAENADDVDGVCSCTHTGRMWTW